jgi:hypothetical protein
MNVNVWDVNDHVQALTRSRQPVEVGALTDPDTPLDLLHSEPRRGGPLLHRVGVGAAVAGSAARTVGGQLTALGWAPPRLQRRASRRPSGVG